MPWDALGGAVGRPGGGPDRGGPLVRRTMPSGTDTHLTEHHQGSKTSGTAPPCATTVLPDQVVQARTCRCTPCETSQALIGRASRICAALLFAAVFSH